MNAPHDPLENKVNDSIAVLTRRREVVAETSKDLIKRRADFYYRLATINAGALTFSVTLFGPTGSKGMHFPFLLFTAWGLLLVALGTCLLRQSFHHRYHMAEVAHKLASAEISYIDADDEVNATRRVVYSDSPEPFDIEREIAINRGNRTTWQNTLDENIKTSKRSRTAGRVMEWTASGSMFLGFALLIAFAIVNR